MRDFCNTGIKLLMLAEHLATNQLRVDYADTHFIYTHPDRKVLMGVKGKYFLMFPFVLLELPGLFCEWSASAEGQLTYRPSPGLMPTYALMEFFGLETDEAIHLFSPDRQNVERFGGKILNPKSNSFDVAQNIYLFMEKTMSDMKQAQKIASRNVLIEKRQLPFIPDKF